MRIATYLECGNYLEAAAAAAGVPLRTVYSWLQRGREEEDGIYRDFSDACGEAAAKAEAKAVERIERAAEKVWQAAAWFLERKFPTRWGLRAQAAEREVQAADLAAQIRETVRAMQASVEGAPGGAVPAAS